MMTNENKWKKIIRIAFQWWNSPEDFDQNEWKITNKIICVINLAAAVRPKNPMNRQKCRYYWKSLPRANNEPTVSATAASTHNAFGLWPRQTPEQCITFDRKLGECWFAICRRCENIANRSPSTAAFCRYAHRRWTWHLSNEKQQAATTQRWPWCVCLTPKTVVATETPGTRYCMPQMVAANVPFLLFDAQHTAHGIPKWPHRKIIGRRL